MTNLCDWDPCEASTVTQTRWVLLFIVFPLLDWFTWFSWFTMPWLTLSENSWENNFIVLSPSSFLKIPEGDSFMSIFHSTQHSTKGCVSNQSLVMHYSNYIYDDLLSILGVCRSLGHVEVVFLGKIHSCIEYSYVHPSPHSNP